MIYTKTNIFKIDSLRRDQIEALRLIRNEPQVWSNLSNPFEINEMEQEVWFQSQSLDPKKQYFGINWDYELIGCCWYDEWDRTNSSCRVGIMINPVYHGNGYGYDVLDSFVEYLMNDMNIHRIWCLVLETNKASLGLFNKLGFVEEGIQREAIYRKGEWQNYIMLSKIKGGERKCRKK